MARKEESEGITAALQTISRQISFVGTSNTGGGAASGAISARSVSGQLMASLDALSLPHHGVQFSAGADTEPASDALIDGLLDAYRPATRGGNIVFEPGRTPGRAIRLTSPTELLGGAARVAARQVRDEADIILDILDRLPDMTRFETRSGVPKLRAARDRVAQRFDDLDDVMADPIGVNLPRAMSTIRRAVKATSDFFDYANLEPEFFDAMTRCNQGDLLSGEPRPVDEDETGLRRSVVRAEEIRAEIREICDAYRRLRGDIDRALEDNLGRTAALLELRIAAVYRSALDLRSIFVRHGTSLPEQDLLFFTDQLRTRIETPRGGATDAIDISVGQLLDWIIGVSKPHADASHLIGALEALDLAILAEELRNQSAALEDLIAEADRLGFAIRLAGPMRQLEELQSQLSSASENADALSTTTSSEEG